MSKPHRVARVARVLTALTACAAALSACENVGSFPDPRHDPVEPSLTTVDAGLFTPPAPANGPAAAPEVQCDPAVADALPARSTTLTRPALRSQSTMTTDDLFEQFSAHCQGCHIDTNLGGFQVKRSNFASAEKQAQLEKSLMRIRANEPGQFMPPPPVGMPFDERAAGDPVREFARVLDTWLRVGRPNDAFPVDAQDGADGAPFLLTKAAADQMTNLGNCIPGTEGFASETERSQVLDDKFTAMTALPERLEQTDLFTLDSKELARHGVVAFAPAYTLWADDAKKIRMVRVPRGESIRFDPEAQTFTIPPNTRFYKTFLKKVKDKQGRDSYRKMETRLIVARPDDDSRKGIERPTALFGSYAWNEDETEAVLVRDPLRNGKPFRDRLVTYYEDEQEIERMLREGEPNLEQKAREKGLSRKYAIPGSERCLHCHMGATGQDFVLGFTPLQLHRRPLGEGGVIEEAHQDELNQLQRLIDYGVITGMSSPADVTQLEDSQGARKPRNDYELDAQGYMLGNCAHCHNPRGFPTSVAEELRDLLNFWPSADGGIFEFPLDRFSPRIFRGANQNTPIPYITPSLLDLPDGYLDQQARKVRLGHDVLPQDDTGNVPVLVLPDEAPWRSLIYRNVDTPFSYSDDSTIFPHMPRDIPGYDCRARQLLGTWMLSIPARWQTTEADEEIEDKWTSLQSSGLPSQQGINLEFANWWADVAAKTRGARNTSFTREALYSDPQPYVEVKPDEPGYLSSVFEGEHRVRQFQETGRYQRCPDKDLDILDPAIVRGERTSPESEEPYTPLEDTRVTYVGGLVPERPHWFVMDLTEPVVEWAPRRSDWKALVVDKNIPLPETATYPDEAARKKLMQDRKTIYLLTGVDAWAGRLDAFQPHPDLPKDLPQRDDVRLTDAVREFARTPFPLGLWTQKPECVEACKFSGEDKVADFPPESRPRWVEWAGSGFSPAPENAPIYKISPGAQVFNSVCANCHGPAADSRGRMADTIADLTGGDTRVANLRDGILKPENRARVFAAAHGIDGETWAARYVLWMGLGGTQRTIPAAVLNVVGNTSIMGVKRQGLEGLGAVGANMLAVPEYLCSSWLRNYDFDVARGTYAVGVFYPKRPERVGAPPLPFFSTNGDAEFWERLCTLNNPAPVRAIGLADPSLSRSERPLAVKTFYQRDAYPAGTLVGDDRGRLAASVEKDNLFPWCLLQGTSEQDQAEILRLYREARPGDDEPPYCPEELTSASEKVFKDKDSFWARRGAMNAGLAVFVYLDELSRGKVEPPPAFDQCEKLPTQSCAE